MMRFLLLLTCVPVSHADDWPSWRGPTRNGLTKEVSGWTKEGWLADQPTWRANVGLGAAAPVIVGSDVFLLGHNDGNDILRCLNATDGQERWRQRYKCKAYGRHHMGDEGLYSGPSSTPEYDPATRLLYTLGADGDLCCWDTAQEGKQRWTLNLYDTYEIGRRPKLTRAPQRDYGYTSSPLVYRDWLLVEVGATKVGSLIAFDKRTGKQVWASTLQDEAGHTGGPALMTIERVPCVVVITQRHVAAIRLDQGHEGKTIATFPWVTDFANTIASPAVHDDCVLVTAAYNMNALCKLRFTLQDVKEQWRKPFPSKVCTPLIYNEHVYVVWQKVRCLSWQTGELQWEGGAFSDPGSCLVTADNKLLAYGHSGKLALIETAPTAMKYQELAGRDKIFSALAWPHVALANQRLYCRDREGNIVCWMLQGKK